MNAAGAIATGRGHDRTHLFLDAILVSDLSSVPVRVRNLSPTGALIEGVDLPSVGSRVVLTRGALEAAGRTMWVAPGRCGLKFDTPLAVSRWLPNKIAPRPAAEAGARSISRDLSIKPEVGRVSRAGVDIVAPSQTTLAIAELAALQYELASLRTQVACDAELSNRRELWVLNDAAERIGRIVALLSHGRHTLS